MHGAPYQGAIFDLDGVLVDTASYHHQAWREIARTFGLDVTPALNERLKGVGREPALDILLEAAGVAPPVEERKQLAAAKNARYVELLALIGPGNLLPGAREVLNSLRVRGVKLAIGSASRNAPMALERLGIAPLFDVIVDGSAATRSKPDPQVFLVAAERMGLAPEACVVLEDAAAGIQAAKAAGMIAVGVGNRASLPQADIVIADLRELDLDAMFPPRTESPDHAASGL